MSIPQNMVLKITGEYCLCPPPDWLEMKQIEPKRRHIPPSRKGFSSTMRGQPRGTTPLIPKTSMPTNPPLLNPTINNDEITKNRLTYSYGYIVPQKQNVDILPKEFHATTNTDDTTQYPDVKKISLIDCYIDRENITLSKSLRIISQTLNNPISTTLKEGRIIIQYNWMNQGCVNNTEFYETSKNIGEAIESILSWLPGYNRLKFIVSLFSSILETFSDALDGNEINIDDVLNLNSQLIGLSKDVISSIKTKDINTISKDINKKQVKNMITPLEYKHNELFINTPHGYKIKAQKNLNHLFDSKNNGFIFYDHEKKWITDNNINTNNHIRETLESSRETWKDTENIFFFKNSSPDIYGDAIILRYHGDTYTLIDGSLYKTIEIQLTDVIFRYLIKDNDDLLPIIHKGESWLFEDSLSPAVSSELNIFLKNNNKISTMLASNSVRHQDVSPLTPGREIQFDKDFNEYLKINNKYYKLKESIDTSHYIEGDNMLLALELSNNQFHIKESLFDGICCFHREPINIIKELKQNDIFFLDNTVTSKINSFKFQSNRQHTISAKDVATLYMEKSKNMDGAISSRGDDYIYYRHNFIKAHSNGDDTYILGDKNDNLSNILIYKKPNGDTYYTIPKTKIKWSGLISKTRRCIVKKQPFSMCNVEYFETERIRYLLKQNSNQGITINNFNDVLDSYENFPGIYKKRDNDNELYYRGEGSEFFHAQLNRDHAISFTPSFFVIYGKSSDQQIDLNSVITSVSIIKDFDTKKIIFSTPGETQEHVFDINKKLSDMYLKWQEQDTTYRDVTTEDLKDLAEKIHMLNDITSLNELFDRNGKKVITSVEYAEKIFKDKVDKILTIPNSFEINNLQALEEAHTYPIIEDICSNAFKKTIKYIKDATTIIESSDEKFDNYVLNVLKISDVKARNLFITSFKKKLNRMSFIFDENNKENIIIMSKKKPNDNNKEILSAEGQNMLGFSILNDPLDRIFINTAVISDVHEDISGTKEKDPLTFPSIPQPETPGRNRIFFINLISETMLHEAIHALGSPEDYLYLNIDDEGRIDNIDDSIKYIETAISEGYMDRIKFEYLSKVYFKSNPLYKGFTSRSLYKQNILKDIFRNDGFFRSIVLLNNPDTISLLIRELAGISLDNEEE